MSTDTLELEPPVRSRSPTQALSSSGGVSEQDTVAQLPATQPIDVPVYVPDPNIWGYLKPYGTQGGIVAFRRWKHIYRFGRSEEAYNIDEVIPDMGISQFHCAIEWSPQENLATIYDNSLNGTFVNHKRIGQGNSRILRDRDQVAFVTLAYTFHIVAPWKRPTRAMYETYDVRGDELGRGAFGAVVKALHMQEGKYYAIKMILHERMEPGTDLSDTIMREVAVMQRVGLHRHICHLKEFFAEEDELALVLELVCGGNLKTYMRKLRPLRMSEAEVQYFTYQICDALKCIHTQGIVHRDLKPENVLLTAHDPPVVKVADFGLARAVDGVALFQTKCGTPAYVAPEVCDQSGGGYDVLVDSWSLGIMIFQMLTLRLPFDDDPRMRSSKIFAPKQTRLIRWDVLDACGVGPDGQAFLRKLLTHNPQGRMTMAAARDHAWLSEVRAMWPTNVKEDGEISDAFHHFLRGVPDEEAVEDAGSALSVDGEAVEITDGEDSERPTHAPGDRTAVADGDAPSSAPFSVGAMQLSTLTDLGGSWMQTQAQTRTKRKTRLRSPSNDDDSAGKPRTTKRPRMAFSGGRAVLTVRRKASESADSAVESGYESWSAPVDTDRAQSDDEGNEDHGGLSGIAEDPAQGVDEGREVVEEQ